MFFFFTIDKAIFNYLGLKELLQLFTIFGIIQILKRQETMKKEIAMINILFDNNKQIENEHNININDKIREIEISVEKNTKEYKITVKDNNKNKEIIIIN